MEFKNWCNPDFHGSYPVPPEDYYNYQIPFDECMEPTLDSQNYESRTGQPMQRYLDEPDHPLFTFSAIDPDCIVPSWPGYPAHPAEYLRSQDPPCDQRHRCPRVASPDSNSASSSSSYVSSNPGEPPEVSSWSSPEVAFVDGVPGTGHHDRIPHGYAHVIRPRRDASCVALHDVQTHADEQPDEPVRFDEGGHGYSIYLGYMDAEDGYQPLDTTGGRHEHDHATSVYQSSPEIVASGMRSTPASPRAPPSPQCRDPSASPNIRRRRAPAASNAALTNGSSTRVTKRRLGTSKCIDEPTPSRPFPCSLAIYGCPSTFASKNEWKRHINTQHMRLDFWRCDQCPATHAPSTNGKPSPSDAETVKKFNDFNRKDLFIQHVRRMHPSSIECPSDDDPAAKPFSHSSKKNGNGSRLTAVHQQHTYNARAQDAALMAIASRCRRRTRSAPAESGCLFCSARFCGEDTWDERLEHIGRHFECMRRGRADTPTDDTSEATLSTDPRRWRLDSRVEDWMIQEGIVVKAPGRGHGWVLAT